MKEDKDLRITTNLNRLISLKEKATGFSFLPNHASTSKLAGRYGSKFRGRGVNFEELRSYKVGDDVKSIDWKVTLKTGEPHVRVYTEEKDHNVFVCVDQTDSMYFSSVEIMKSVVAAEIAALCSWRTLSDNDRVGGLLMTEEGLQSFSPKRGNKEITRMLSLISEANNNLSDLKTSHNNKEETKLEEMVDFVLKKKLKESVIILISDFYNLKEETMSKMKALQEHNDILCIHIFDELEKNWTEKSEMVFSDGNMQINVENEDEKVSKYFLEKYNEKTNNLSKILKAKGVPLIELNTEGDHIRDFIKQVSGGNNV